MKSDSARIAALLIPRNGSPIFSERLRAAVRAGVVGDLRHLQVRVAVDLAADLPEYAKRLHARRGLAVVEFTMSAREVTAVLERVSRMLGTVVAELADSEQSNIVVGHLHVVDEREGDTMAVITDRRHPNVTEDQFFEWWLTHHVPVGQQLCGGTLPFSAEMIHVDRELSRRACELASVTWKPLDGYESLVSDAASLAGFFANEQVQQGLADDEAGGRIELGSITCAIVRVETPT